MILSYEVIVASTPMNEPSQPTIGSVALSVHVYVAGSEAPALCRYVIISIEVPLKFVLTAMDCQPEGAVTVGEPEPVTPMATSMTSFCCVPAGVSMTMLFPLATVLDVVARSVGGEIFLSAVVTAHDVAGRRAMAFVT